MRPAWRAVSDESITMKRDQPSVSRKSVKTQAAPSATWDATSCRLEAAESCFITVAGGTSAAERSSMWVDTSRLPGMLAIHSCDTAESAPRVGSSPARGARKNV